MNIPTKEYFLQRLKGKLGVVRKYMEKIPMIEALRNFKQSVEIPEIQRAIDRIHDGTYGICQGCQNDIPVGRLKVRPETRFCVSCQKEREGQNLLTITWGGTHDRRDRSKGF